jgi:hypothetical protein
VTVTPGIDKFRSNLSSKLLRKDEEPHILTLCGLIQHTV